MESKAENPAVLIAGLEIPDPQDVARDAVPGSFTRGDDGDIFSFGIEFAG